MAFALLLVTATRIETHPRDDLESSSTDIPSTTGLVGYWNFDEGTGSVAHDSSGSGYDGTVNGATWTSGKVKSALSFDGFTNDVVTPNIALGNSFSISAWVNSAIPGQPYLRIAETYYAGGFYLGTDAAGAKYKFIVNNGSGSSGSCGAAYGCAEGGAVTSGWHLLTGTYDGTTAILYVDNAIVASDTSTGPGSTNYPLYIGRDSGSVGHGWNGVIDEVRLYNRALTGAEISALCGTGCAATPHSVALTWTSSTSSNLSHYKVYRGPASGGPYAFLASTVGLATSYTDYTVQAGQNYSYVVTVVDNTGAESVYSNMALATVPNP